MRKVKKGYILPSAALTVERPQIVQRKPLDRPPCTGDLVYGTVVVTGAHRSLENKEGRIHTIYDGSKAIFIYGNRYAPDAFEGVVPDESSAEVDMLARSGIVGRLLTKNTNALDCTRIKIYGHVCNADGKPLNTRDFPRINPVYEPAKRGNRAKMILCIGGAMNSGKSLAAANCCWALSTMGHKVNASKVTGTASLKDILLMEDSGAAKVNDFTFLGHPSTYLLDEHELLGVFRGLDAACGSQRGGYWVVEIADGIMQRETAMLLRSDEVKNRIHKLIYCARDAVGVLGGLKILRDEFGLTPDAFSGFCGSSPLAMRELAGYTDIPFFDSVRRDLETMARILV